MWDDDEEEDGNWDQMEGIFTGTGHASSSGVAMEARKSDSRPKAAGWPSVATDQPHAQAPVTQGQVEEVKDLTPVLEKVVVTEEPDEVDQHQVTLMKATAKAKAAPAAEPVAPLRRRFQQAWQVEDLQKMDEYKQLSKTQKKKLRKQIKSQNKKMETKRRKQEREAYGAGSNQAAGARSHRIRQVYPQPKGPREEDRTAGPSRTVRAGPGGGGGRGFLKPRPRMMPRGSFGKMIPPRPAWPPPPAPAAHVVESHSVKSMQDVQHLVGHLKHQEASRERKVPHWESHRSHAGLPRNKVAKVAAPPEVQSQQQKAGMEPALEPERGDHMDCFGRDFKLNEVVVNFANVGHTYGIKVLKQQRGQDGFDWEGVRRCVRFLKAEAQMKVTGVITENFVGLDNRLQRVALPADIKKMCESVEETPRVTGRNHTSADDEMTIKCAYRRACRFLDNDNYREWMVQLGDAKARTWLQTHRELVHMRYYFDKGLGTFDLLSGNYPVTSLAMNDAIEKRNLSRMGRG